MYNKKYLKKCMAVILSASMVMPTSIASMASEPATEVTTEAAVEETEIAQTEAATEADTEAAAETEAVETEQTGKETEPATETVTESTAVQESAAEEAAVLSDDWDDEYSVDFKMIYFDSDGSDLWSEEHIVKDSFSWTFNPYVPVKEGYTFKGWATKKGSSTVVYKAGDKITVTEADEYEKIVRLYAVWEKQGTTYKVTYYNEDGSQELKTDSKVSTAASCSFSAYTGAAKKEGYEFIGWSKTPNATAIDYNTTKGPVLKSTSPELKLYAVYVKTVQNEPVKVNVYVEYLDESLEKGYEVDESSRQEVTLTCGTTYAHKESGYVHQLKYKDIADAARPGSIKVKDGYEIVGMTKNAGTNQNVYALDNTFMSSGMMQNGSFYLVAKKKQGTTYKVTYYNADGSQELKTDSKVSTADSCSFSAYAGAEKKEGYEFIGWSTKPNATAIDYNTTKGPVLKSTSPELKLYAVYVKTVQNEDVKVNVYVEYLDESLEKGYEVDESSRQEVTLTCGTTYAHKESGYVHQLKYKDIADAARPGSIKVKDGYEIVGMTKNAGTNQNVYALDNTFMSSGMMQNGSFYLVAKKKQGTTYKVTYYNADGSQELKTDSKVSTADSCSFSAYAGAEKKEGYEFIGWSKTPNATAIDYNTTKGPVLKSTSPELKLYAVYVKTVQNEDVKLNVYVEYLDESLEKGYEVDETSRQEVTLTCGTTYAHKESGYVHQLKYKDIADAAKPGSIKVKDGYEIVGMTKNAGTNQNVYALDNTFMSSGMMQNGSFYLVAKKKQGTTYKVTYYNADGSQELKTDSKVSTADSCSFSAYAGAEKKEGYEFIGWSTKPNATAIDYNTTKGPVLKSTSPELKLYAVYVKTVQNEDVKVNVYVEYLDESLEKGYEVDEASKKEVTVTCETTYAHKESGSVHQLKYKTIADAADVSSFKVRDGYEIVGMTKNAGANEVYFALDNTFMTSGMMQDGSFYLVAKKAKQPETEPGTEESESEKQTESESEKQTESETEKQPESETEKKQETEKQPESETEKKQETEKQPESETEKKQETEKQPETEAPSKPSATTTSTVVMRLRGNASSTRVRLAWTRIKGADGYEIYGANCKVSTKAPLVKTVKNGSAYVTAISGLKKASSYRYYVTAYKMVNGKKTYLNQSNTIYIATACGTRTNAKAVTVASTSITLKKGKTKNLSATVTSVNSKKKLFYRTAKLTYTTTDKKIATVTSRGTVTAKAKGTCYIYVSAANGVYTKVKVTVN